MFYFEYVQIKEIYCKSPETRRAIIVPKSELSSQYDYIREAEITICESTTEVDIATEPACEICKTTLSQPLQQMSLKQGKMCNECFTKHFPKVTSQNRREEQKKHKRNHRGDKDI